MKKLFAVLAAIFLLAIIACSGGGDNETTGGNSNSKVTVQGNLAVPSGDNATQYTVFNSNQISTPSSSGSFSISATKDIPTYTYAISNNGKKVYAAVRTSADGSDMTINAQSTAEAMVLLNPLLIPRTIDERIKIINIVRSDTAVRTLATVIESVYGSVDDPLSDTRISEALTNAVKSVLTSWQTSNKSADTVLQQTIRKGSALTYAVVRAASKGSSIQIYPTSSGVDMGALTLANSSGSTLKLELSNDVGPLGITTNVDWVVRIVELDPTKIQWTDSGVPILPTDINIDSLIKTGGYDQPTIIEGAVGSGLLSFIVDPIGKVATSFGAIVFPDNGISLPHDGVYAVIAFSGSPFGDSAEYNSVMSSAWQTSLWAEAASINIGAAAIDIVGVGTTFANAAGADIPDLSPLLEVELGAIKAEIAANPSYVGSAYFVGKTADILGKLLDSLKPYIHSSISDLQSSGLKKFFHIAINTVTSVVDVWSGTISASTRIGNYLFSVTPRESGYAVLGTFSGQAPSTPTGFSVTAATSSQINLAWTAPTGTVTGYKVYKDGTYLKSVTTTSTSDTGLSASTNYCYYVTAYNAAGESAQTSQLCATTQAPPVSPPSTPTGFTVTAASSSQINLAWTASTGTVEGYKVYKSGTYLKSVATTSASDTGLSASTNYCYYVTAYNSAGESVQTSQLCATTQSVTYTYSISGRVTLNGSGLSGVTITLTGSGSTSRITDSGGNYSFSGAANGSYTVTPSMTGYTFTPANRTANVSGANFTVPDFVATVTSSTNDYTSPNIGTLKYVPAGSFQRDGTASNISTVSAFRMSQYEITRAQFLAIMGTDPSYTPYSSGTNDPVGANWYHAIAFCNKLSIAEGLTPVYSVSGINFTTLTYAAIPTISDTTWDAATANWSANGYRLPTEMEWEWAAMGATAGATGYLKAFAGSTGSNAIGDYAWTWENSSSGTKPVGTKLPNELGLYDMSGNVWEWCWDWYADNGTWPYYAISGTVTNYRGAASGTYRVIRGGGWSYNASLATVANRGSGNPDGRNSIIGIRVVRP